MSTRNYYMIKIDGTWKNSSEKNFYIAKEAGKETRQKLAGESSWTFFNTKEVEKEKKAKNSQTKISIFEEK